ncbi:GDP-mannose transporter GONST5 [Sesamum angolense]|uniref:GDP-mannose transporter GONST5 n=1 Tax=Sesamum angolense TaxID=2727404 RepID=A0AAE1WAA1_9LAMI|nr:GDP-mannose transporter GONST5 [Sesamum angolense]
MEDGRLCQWSVIRSILAILQWWGFNVTVIIMNKWIFQKLDFKYPLSVSCIHLYPRPSVHTCYLAVANLEKYFDWRIWASLIPIVGGILLTSITELSFNMLGFCAALFGCLATSTKTILAESLLHGYKFDSINTVYYMAPFATMILAVPALLLEGSGVMEWVYTCPSLFTSLVIIFGSGVLAFCLNFSIFYVIHSTTAVTFNVAGNLKVAVAVTCSWLIFRNPISLMNAVGCSITLVGCTFYGYVRHMLSHQTPGTPRTPRSKIELIPLTNDKLDDKV